MPDTERATSVRPKIGEPRVYSRGTQPLLYPGEMAIAQIRPEAIARAIIEAQRSGRPPGQVEVDGWLVQPSPGWHAVYLRWRWRLIGQWLGGGAPKLVGEIELIKTADEMIRSSDAEDQTS